MTLRLLCLMVLLLPTAQAAELYVSPSGDDMHAGTKETPFRTLTRARNAVREINKDMTGDIFVWLLSGEYALAKTVEFGAEDSGHNGHRIIYGASPGEDPILTGGIRVTDWQLHDPEQNIHRAPASVNLFRQVYIDGTPAIRARTPNRESETESSPYWPCIVPDIPKMRIKEEHWLACARVPKEKLTEVEMVMVCHWYHQRVRIGTVNTVGMEVELTPVEPSGKFNKVLHFYQNNKGIKNPFYFENALAFVDTPREWYHDPTDGRLFLALPRGVKPDTLHIEIPSIDTLVSIRGTAERPVANIEFRGLTFQISNWSGPSRRGVNMTQAAQVVGGEQPKAMIEGKHVRGLAFRNCSIRNTGGHGIRLFDADASDIEGNRFENISANGIDIDAGGGKHPPPEKQSSDIAIWNNRAQKCGSHYANGIFLMANNVQGLIVAHNLIHDMPYSGMQIGQQPGKMQDIGCGHNRILNNHIHDCNQIHGDGGAIYTLGGIQEGSVIAGNYVHDIHQSKWDHYRVDHIYLDNFTSKITVRDNVVKAGRAAERNGSAGNTVLNNPQSDVAIEQNAGIEPGYNPRAVY